VGLTALGTPTARSIPIHHLTGSGCVRGDPDAEQAPGLTDDTLRDKAGVTLLNGHNGLQLRPAPAAYTLNPALMTPAPFTGSSAGASGNWL
jgi:hypothetical protein